MKPFNAVKAKALTAPVGFHDPTLMYDDQVMITNTRAITMAEVPMISLAYLSDDEKIAAHAAMTSALIGFKGRRVTFRSLQSPTDVNTAATRLDARVHDQGVPEVTWAEHLNRMKAQHLACAPTRKRTFVEVDLGARSWRTSLTGKVLRDERAGWGEKAQQVRRRLAGSGLGATAVDSATVRAIRRRALVRGPLVAPGAVRRWSYARDETRDEFADLEFTLGPRWVKVSSVGGSRYVATFVVSAIPDDVWFPTQMPHPWLSTLDSLAGFTVDTDLVLDLVPYSKAIAELEVQYRYALDQRETAGSVDKIDMDVRDLFDLLPFWKQLLKTDRMPTAHGWARVRVDADDPKDLASMFEAIHDHMDGSGGTGVAVAWPGGRAQMSLLAEGVPGSQVNYTAWKKRMFLPYATSAMPHVGSTLGHGTGAYRGFTTTRDQRNAVLIDLHHAITRPDDETAHVERPGGVAFLGAQGSGKSTALLSCLFQATMEGKEVLALDPSGPMARAATMPHWTPGKVEAIDLLEVGGGVVDPLGPVLIPMPAGADDLTRQVIRRERSLLADQTFRILAWSYFHGDQASRAEEALVDAITHTAEQDESSSSMLIDHLCSSTDEVARSLGKVLRFRVGSGDSGALVGSGAQQIASTATTRIISMRGLAGTMPKSGKSIDHWLPAEALAAATFGCAAYLCRRLLTGSSPDTLKLFVGDEVHVLMATDAGRGVIEGLLRDGRKHGVVACLATHNAADLSDERFTAAIAQWFLFRTNSRTEAQASNGAAGLEVEADPAKSDPLVEVRRGLVNGECLALLDNGTRGRFRWDTTWIPGFAAMANTTPSGRKQEATA